MLKRQNRRLSHIGADLRVMVHLSLSTLQKKELCEFRDQHPMVSQAKLIEEAKNRFGFAPSQAAISRMLSKKDVWKQHTVSKKRKRDRPPKWPTVEKALDVWFDQVQLSWTHCCRMRCVDSTCTKSETSLQVSKKTFGTRGRHGCTLVACCANCACRCVAKLHTFLDTLW